jgi:hypothetical protein
MKILRILAVLLLVSVTGCAATLFDGRLRLTFELPGIVLPDSQPFSLVQGLIEDLIGK